MHTHTDMQLSTPTHFHAACVAPELLLLCVHAAGSTPTIRRIEERISRLTMTQAGQGEGLQILRYEPGEKYDSHHDYFSHDAADDQGGNRLLTGLMYLSDVEEGGETVFPKVVG